MGRAIQMENELEKVVGRVTILQSRMNLLEDCLEELINKVDPLFDKKNEKKTKKPNKK